MDNQDFAPIKVNMLEEGENVRNILIFDSKAKKILSGLEIKILQVILYALFQYYCQNWFEKTFLLLLYRFA